MTQLRKGERVLVSGKVPATVVSIDHRQVTVRLEDGRTSVVMSSSLERVK